LRAIVQDGYGSPDVLALRDIETPAIDDRGVLVEVHAASVNALELNALPMAARWAKATTRIGITSGRYGR
jgi:NADPH:quinone reductase-like Zn-dependent oxidoreductase